MAVAKCKKKIREDNTGVDFVFNNGETISVLVKELSKDMKTNLILHGISQKVGDSYAGKDFSVDDCIGRARDLVGRLLDGDWKTVRAAGAGKRSSMLLEAFMRASGKLEDECREVLEEMDDDQKAALQAHDAIKMYTAQIRAERQAAKASDLAKKHGDVKFSF